jgi:hypothetical protein
MFPGELCAANGVCENCRREAKIHQRGITSWRTRKGNAARGRRAVPAQKQRKSPGESSEYGSTANHEECREIEETGKAWRMAGGWLEQREDKQRTTQSYSGG